MFDGHRPPPFCIANSFSAHTPQALLPYAPSAFHHLYCYHRQPWLASAGGRDLFLRVLEQVRQRFIVVVGYLAMPEHIHLLISEPEKADPSKVMQALKQGFAQRVLRELRKRRVPAQQELFDNRCEHVWQHRFYDFNVWTARKRIEKLR